MVTIDTVASLRRLDVESNAHVDQNGPGRSVEPDRVTVVMANEALQLIGEMLRTQSLASLTLEEQRAVVERGAGSPPPGTEFDAVDANGVACEWVRAPGAGAPLTIVSLRGGGYCLGSLSSNHHFSALLSEATGARVLNVGYRSAPEHRFPAALDDAVAAYRWLIESGTPASQIALAGNSAGGGLTLAVLLALRDAGDPLPGCAAVVSPWTDLAGTGASINTNAATEMMLDPARIRESAALYVDDRRLTDPYVSPLYGDPRGLPPILIHVSGSEILLDDSVRFVEKARAHNVEVELRVVADMPHVWHLFAGFLPEADDALGELGRWIIGHLGPA